MNTDIYKFCSRKRGKRIPYTHETQMRSLDKQRILLGKKYIDEKKQIRHMTM